VCDDGAMETEAGSHGPTYDSPLGVPPPAAPLAQAESKEGRAGSEKLALPDNESAQGLGAGGEAPRGSW